MARFGDWPHLERLTNDEFLMLLPHLSLEQYLLTQIFVPKKKWIRLLDANLQTLNIKCGVCNRQVRFEDIKNHLMENDYVSLRSNIKQFYHPFYTYGKVDIVLARGESAPQEVRERALREVNMMMKSFRKDYIFAQKFVNVAQRSLRKLQDEQLIETTLSNKIQKPDDMIVMVSIPFEDIHKVRFCVDSGEWDNLFRSKKFSKKATFLCNICSVYCCGIESINSHLAGFVHRSKQLDVLAVCYEDSSRVNKNCCIQFGNVFTFSLKEGAQSFLKNQTESDSKDLIGKIPDEIAKKVIKLDEYVPKIPTCSENSLDQSNATEVREKVEKLQSCENLGHLGVEYVLKIVKNDADNDPKFECGLCEFVGNGMKMQRHLLSYDHKKKYLDLHYSRTIKKYEGSLGHMSYKEFRAVMGEIVTIVAVEIEKCHSRSLPFTVSLSEYNARRPDVITESYALLHASQNRGPSFSNVLSRDEIKKLKNSAKQLAETKRYENINDVVFTIAPKGQIYLNQISHDPLVRLNKNRLSRNTRPMSPIPRQVNENFTKRGDENSELSHKWDQGHHRRSRSPMYPKSRTVNQNIWDIYRNEIAFAANEIEVSYENYRKNPESHPLYEEEWNNFWHHRKKELEREGYNHRSYNFQPEWVHYFKQRIEVLFGEALHKSKIDIRYRLGIPLDAEEDFQSSDESANYNAHRRMKDNDTIRCKEIDEFKAHKRRSTPDSFDGCAPQNKKPFVEQIPEQKQPDLNINKSQLIISKISDNHSNVIHVLRIMTALEEHLGSLGGKIIDLLSNALQLEKKYSGNNIEFEAKVLTTANCDLLETAMEKLKGVLYAGFLDEKKITGFNRVIQHTANLLKYADKMGWRQEINAPEKITFPNSEGARSHQMYVTDNRNSEETSQMSIEKTLSATLMDLVNTSQTNDNQIHISKEKYRGHAKEHSNLPDCPPPPNIKETSVVNSNVFGDFKGQHSNSGLASFDTKLSLDRAIQAQERQRNLHLQSEVGQLHRNKIDSRNNFYSNSFKINNDTRTNMNTRTMSGPNMGGGGLNNISGTSLQFRNSQIIPNAGQNNAMFQGGGGGNRNKNWSQWNHNR